MIDKLESHKKEDEKSSQNERNEKLSVFWSKSVSCQLASVKINRPFHYAKAFELFRSITKLGNIEQFISEINTRDSEFLRFGGHKYNGIENQYIFEIGEADRVIIHTKTGQVLFVGNPDYHK